MFGKVKDEPLNKTFPLHTSFSFGSAALFTDTLTSLVALLMWNVELKCIVWFSMSLKNNIIKNTFHQLKFIPFLHI